MKKFLGTLVLGAALLINGPVTAETEITPQKQKELIATYFTIAMAAFEHKQIIYGCDNLLEINKFSAASKSDLQKVKKYSKKYKCKIAKKEPSQTQEVAEKEVTWEVISRIQDGIYPNDSYDYPFFISKESFVLKQGTNDQYKFLKIVYDKSLTRCLADVGGYTGAKCVIKAIKYIEPSNPSAKQIIKKKDGIELKNIKVSWNGIDNKDTQIVQKEPTIKPKKKEEKENLVEELNELAKLYEEGVLSEDEFSQLKAKVLEQKKPSQSTKVVNKKIFKIGFNKSSTQSEEKCIPEKRRGFVKKDGKTIFAKKKYCISIKDINKVGIYQEFNDYPEGMLKEFGNCKKFFCQSKIATKRMYNIFIQRGPQYHARHPEKMLQGMAWYEIMYLAKLKKTMPTIERYIEYIQGNHNYKNKTKKTRDEGKIDSLINMNKAREKMRVAMGLSLEDDLASVLKNHWLLGDLIGNNELKVKKVKMNSEMKKRKELLAKYQGTLKLYKTKLEEEKNTKSNN